MAFNSFTYLLFLAVAVLLFYVFKEARAKTFLVIAASAFFLFWFNPLSLFVLLMMASVNYVLLQQIDKDNNQPLGRALFVSGLVLNIASLFVYRFLQDYFSKAHAGFFEGYNNTQWIILGIGFYTLQALSFYFNVFQRGVRFRLSFHEFLLAMVFFAKLPAGPLLNHTENNNLAAAMQQSYKQENIIWGIQRILLGLFKKMALADRLLPFTNSFFDAHGYLYGSQIYLAPFIFTLQLYFDFSGYADIAVGSARLFGIRLPENFALPLRATSIVAFWRRWHITLVNWLTQYVYYPISFKYRKLKKKGIAIAITVTFIISALWHGFAITFFIWALCHFTYMIVENLFFKKEKKDNGIIRFLKIAVVWHLVAFSNLFFRSRSLDDVRLFFSDFRRLPFLYPDNVNFKTWLLNGGQDIENEFNFRLALLLSIVFLILEKRFMKYADSAKYHIVYVALMLVLLAVFGMFNTGERFIYLQF